MDVRTTRHRVHVHGTGCLSLELYVTPETSVCGRCG